MVDEKGRFKKGSIPWNKDKKGSQKGWNKGLKLGPAWNKGLPSPSKGVPRTKEVKEKISKAKTGKPRPDMKGENNWNWKGGKTKERELIRKSIQYKKWRYEVFKRDDFTCVFCHKKEEVSGKLNADHIKPFSIFPELRYIVSNGRTLCVDCHKLTDTYLTNIHKYKKSLCQH